MEQDSHNQQKDESSEGEDGAALGAGDEGAHYSIMREEERRKEEDERKKKKKEIKCWQPRNA